MSAELLLEMGRIARGNLNRDEALQKIALLILHNFEVSSAAVLLREAASDALYVAASVCRDDREPAVPPDITLKVGRDSFLSRALREPEQSSSLEGGIQDPVLGMVKESLTAFPMTYGRRIPGLLLVGICPGRSIQEEPLMAIAAQAGTVALRSSLIENLRQSEERYQSLMENASDLVFLLDKGGRFLYVNQACTGVFSCPPEDVRGRYFGEFVTPESWAKTVATVKKGAQNRKKYIEYSWEVANNSTVTVLDVRASLLYQDGELLMHQGIARDLSRERMLKEEIAKRGLELNLSKSREERMREYLAVASMAQEEERARIAREIHDGALQYLIALGRRLDLLEKSIKGGAQEFGTSFEDVHSLLDVASSHLREFARNLRPPVLDDFGLVSACEWLADQTQKEGIATRFSVKGPVRRLPQEVENSAFRIAQEALSNTIKHSGATSAEFTMEFTDEWLTLVVQDNGKGFESPGSPGALVRAGQMGLVGMFERAELLSAVMDLKSHPGSGTRLSVKIPLTA